jgi:signal transduction histidine kinase
MNLTNWIYLGVGIALGIVIRWLFVRSQAIAPDDKHQLESQLKQIELAYQMADQMSQFKAGFLARTTHELRSPLNGLIGLHQLILSDLCENPAEEREFITQAHERAQKLHRLMDEILCVARIEHGTHKLDIQPLQIALVLQEVHSLTYMLATNRNLSLLVSVPDPEIHVLADPRWLRQILINLVDTAICHLGEGSICLSGGVVPRCDCAYIRLDVPTQATTWSEAIDLITSEDEPRRENVAMSSGMKLLLNQTLLEVMGGKLEILPSPIHKESQEPSTSLQVTLPLVIPEVELG